MKPLIPTLLLLLCIATQYDSVIPFARKYYVRVPTTPMMFLPPPKYPLLSETCYPFLHLVYMADNHCKKKCRLQKMIHYCLKAYCVCVPISTMKMKQPKSFLPTTTLSPWQRRSQLNNDTCYRFLGLVYVAEGRCEKRCRREDMIHHCIGPKCICVPTYTLKFTTAKNDPERVYDRDE